MYPGEVKEQFRINKNFDQFQKSQYQPPSSFIQENTLEGQGWGLKNLDPAQKNIHPPDRHHHEQQRIQDHLNNERVVQDLNHRKTRFELEQQNYQQHLEEQKINQKYLQEKAQRDLEMQRQELAMQQ